MNFTAPQASVLAVDDQEINLMVLERLLGPAQVRVTMAAGGREMLDLLCRERFDLILLDHVMPPPDGLEAFHLSHTLEGNLNADTPFVALTGNDVRREDADPSLSPREATRAYYKGEGFADYLPKPVLPDTLEGILRELLPAEKLVFPAGGAAAQEGPVAGRRGLYARALELQQRENCGPDGSGEGANPDLDIARGLAFSAGDAGMYRELLKNWADAYMENGYTIQKSAKGGDLESHRIAAHSLKSSSRMVGAMRLGDLAERAEHAARDGDLASVREHVAALLEQYGRSVEAASAYLAG